jgi:hypothetical protein
MAACNDAAIIPSANRWLSWPLPISRIAPAAAATPLKLRSPTHSPLVGPRLSRFWGLRLLVEVRGA